MTNNLKKEMKFVEFIFLMAIFVSLMAISLDTILPALPLMQQDLGFSGKNQSQFIITSLLLGSIVGQIIFGAISDSFGRRSTIYIGLTIFAIGSVVSMVSQSLFLMLVGRMLQGFGVAAPKILSTAIVRDLYKGREMARTMSIIMSIFILTPAIAPTVGQLILSFLNWRAIFVLFLIFALISGIWSYFRLPETLKSQDRKEFKLNIVKKAFIVVVSNKITLGYAICAGLIFGSLVGYITSSRQIFQEHYDVGNLFALYFAISALSIGVASITNSVIVKRLGMRIICQVSLTVMAISSALFLALMIFQSQEISVLQFMIYSVVTFFSMGLTFGNLNSLAMGPMGHFAGMAAAIIGSISSLISLLIGILIGQNYNNTLFPITFGFLTVALSSLILQFYLERQKKEI